MAEIDLSIIADRYDESDVISVIQGEVRKVCFDALEKALSQTVYGWSPNAYYRTGALINAIDIVDLKISGTSASFRLTVNPSKISPLISPAQGAPFGYATWGSHVGFGNQEFTEGLVEILDQGGGSRWYTHQAHGFFDKTKSTLDSQLPNILASALRARGWDIS